MTKDFAQNPPKTHYEILDGLRGVAAIMVVCFHILETYSGDSFHQIINHGYLAVDFFFVLSGFVVAYAYDDRWAKMNRWDFYKRRIIRLQPLVILGMTIGAALFYFQRGAAFPLIHSTPGWKLFLVMLLGYTMLPLPVKLDIRGWREMHPLNGPAWSLFFEYIANFLYAVWIRKFSKKQLTVFVVLAGLFLLQYLLQGSREDDVIGGWSVDKTQLHIGFARLLYPFFAGVLLMRLGKSITLKGAFPICSALLILVLAFPRVGGQQHLWMNGLYESVCILLVFPLIVVLGAGGEMKNPKTVKVCRFLGTLSYPLYILHFPLIYTYWAWVKDNKIPMSHGLWVGFVLLITAIAIALVALKFYDEPIRKWLTGKFLSRKSEMKPEPLGITPTSI